MTPVRYKSIILKISGELLAGKQGHGIDPRVIEHVAGEIKEVHELGVRIGIIIGGGNIFRGLSAALAGINRITGDNMGMLATVINSLALQDYLERLKINTRVCTAVNIEKIAEPFIRRRVMRHLEKGRVVILAGGTGHPIFTTDTAAALRAVELGAEVIIKGTRVDGVYSADPEKYKDAVRFEELSYIDIVEKGLKVMDATAATLAMDNKIPMIVFDFTVPGNLVKIVRGEKIGTLVRESDHD